MRVQIQIVCAFNMLINKQFGYLLLILTREDDGLTDG